MDALAANKHGGRDDQRARGAGDTADMQRQDFTRTRVADAIACKGRRRLGKGRSEIDPYRPTLCWTPQEITVLHVLCAPKR